MAARIEHLSAVLRISPGGGGLDDGDMFVFNLEEDNICNRPLLFGTMPDINHLHLVFLQPVHAHLSMCT